MLLTSDEAWPERSGHRIRSYQGQPAALLPAWTAFRNLQVLVITFQKAEDLQGAAWRGLHMPRTLPQQGPPKE